MKAIYILVYGDVQGVFYRHFTKKEANKLGILGWCQNEIDGSVKIFAQGAEKSIESFIEWVKIGSPMSDVKSIKTEKTQLKENLTGFEIK